MTSGHLERLKEYDETNLPRPTHPLSVNIL
jgi:hypothetical protein